MNIIINFLIQVLDFFFDSSEFNMCMLQFCLHIVTIAANNIIFIIKIFNIDLFLYIISCSQVNLTSNAEA